MLLVEPPAPRVGSSPNTRTGRVSTAISDVDRGTSTSTTIAGLDAHHRALLVRPWEVADVVPEAPAVIRRVA